MPRPKDPKDSIPHKRFPNAYLRNRGGVIYFFVEHGKKRYRKSSNLYWNPKNFNIAHELLTEFYLSFITDEVPPSKLSEVFETFLNLKMKSVTHETIKKYKQAWNHWIKADYDTTDIDKIKNDIAQLVSKSKLHNNTIAKGLELLSSFFSYCVEFNHIDKNPITSSIVPSRTQEEPQQFTKAEIDMLINYYAEGSDMRNLLILISNTGLRINEAVTLKPESFSDDYIEVIGKGKRKRKIPILPNSTLQKICKVISKREKPFIWVGPTVPHRKLSKCCKKLNIENKGYHGIRKYFENMLIDAGINIKIVAEILGHTLAIQSKHYVTRASVVDMKKALESIME